MTKRKLLIMEPFRNKNLEKIKQALKEDFFIKQLVYDCTTEELKREIIDAIIVNVGRGNFIDCMALDKLLSSGHLWGAALDVTNPEPLPQDHPLWNNPKCMITPHASGTTFKHLDATEDLLCGVVCDNLSKYYNGEPIGNRVY